MSNSSITGGEIKLSYDWLDAANRLESDLAAIYEATNRTDLEFLVVRIDCEISARKLSKVLSPRFGADVVLERLQNDLETIRNSVSLHDLRRLEWRLTAESAAYELNAMIQPR